MMPFSHAPAIYCSRIFFKNEESTTNCEELKKFFLFYKLPQGNRNMTNRLKSRKKVRIN